MGMHAWQMIAHAASAAVDLRLGVREHLWLAGFCCLFRQLTHSRSSVSVHWCGSQSLCVCVSFWSRCICVALPGFRVSQHTHVHSPSPRSISQSIKCLLPVSMFTAGQQQTVCILTVRVYSRGNHTQPSHSPSFGEAFPTAISPRRPALSLLRALQQCVPPRLQPTSRCGPGPAIFLAFPPLASPAWRWCCYYYCYCAVISCMSDCTRDKCQMSCPD